MRGLITAAVTRLIAKLAGVSGASLVGWISQVAGAVARTINDRFRDAPSSADMGCDNTGAVDATVKLQALFDHSANNNITVVVYGGTYLVGKLKLKSNASILCIGEVTLRARDNLNDDVLVNDDMVAGNSGILIRGVLKIDGNYLNQTTGNGITFSKVTGSKFDHLEGNYCKGHGILFTDSSGNTVKFARAVGNGKTVGAYGVYLFESNRNRILASYTEDNCIGIALEAGGAGKTCSRNLIAFTEAVNNRADFSQSGAGVHLEASGGGSVADNMIIYPDCRGSTGVGINLTNAHNARIVAPVLRDNSKSGFTALQSLNIQITGGEIVNNAGTEGAGYQAQMRFDDAGLTGCTGKVIGLKASGAAVGVKTFSAGCGMSFEGCDITGTAKDYELNGVNDGVSTIGRNGQHIRSTQIAFNAGKTAGTAVIGQIVFDSALLNQGGAYSAGTGSFTAKVAGVHVFHVNVRAGGAMLVEVDLKVNGVARANWKNKAAEVTQSGAAGSVLLPLAAGDVVGVFLVSGDTYGAPDKVNFSGYFLG